MVIIYIMTVLSIIYYVWICMVIYPCYITYYFIYIYCWSDHHYEKKNTKHVFRWWKLWSLVSDAARSQSWSPRRSRPLSSCDRRSKQQVAGGITKLNWYVGGITEEEWIAELNWTELINMIWNMYEYVYVSEPPHTYMYTYTYWIILM